MTIPLAEIVESKALLQTVLYSMAAAVGVTVAFSLAVYGAARGSELRRAERPLAAAVAGAVMLIGLGACGIAVLLGFVVMTSK